MCNQDVPWLSQVAEGVWTFCALDAARNADLKTIDSDKHFKTLRLIEADIIAGYKTVVSGIIFVNENHWAFFVLDLKSRTLGYGDSFGGKMPAHIKAAFT